MKLPNPMLLLTAFCLACTYYDHDFSYDFEKGVEVIHLKNQLKEISGLCYKDVSTLYAIQDEEGEIFEINTSSGEHKKIIDFKKEGDFEGIAAAKGKFYALKSDGDIYKIERSGKDEKYTFFSDEKGFEFEGLTLDSDGKNLLVSCKQHGKKSKNDHIYVYKYSLEKNEYLKEPFLKIPKKSIHKNFKPSGITLTQKNTILLISAISYTIAEVDKSGNLIRKAQLPYLKYNQVEGICLGEEGNLYIASEKGKQDQSKIIKLNQIEK